MSMIRVFKDAVDLKAQGTIPIYNAHHIRNTAHKASFASPEKL